MATVLELRQVTKRFASQSAVAGVSLLVRGRRVFFSAGAFGLRQNHYAAHDRRVRNASGEIWLNGARIDALPPYHRNVNTVFQSYALFPHLTVRGNVEFGLRRKKARSEIEARVRRRCWNRCG